MRPTDEEIVKHFKGVTKVLDYLGSTHFLGILKEIKCAERVVWCTNEEGNNVILWEPGKGYATILEKMSKADEYFIDILNEIKTEGEWDKNPRPKWSDGSPAFSKFITQKSFEYRIDKGEFPIISFRPTAIKGGWYDIEAIYQKQTNIIEEMNPLIQPWWEPFVVYQGDKIDPRRDIGQTYGHTVKRYDLMNRLLSKLQNDGYSRRHILSLWQEQQMYEDPNALVPCAFQTIWSSTEDRGEVYIDLTLDQRSQDFMVTSSINPMQYVMKGMAVCGHLSFHTGVKHTLRNFKHNVQNLHIYDRHIFAIDELLKRKISNEKFNFELPVNKDFYDYTFKDFVITKPSKIEPLSQKLEIAV